MIDPSDLAAVGPTSLGEYVAVVRARKWSILLVTLAVVGVAVVAMLVRTPMYESEAQVLVQPVVIRPGEDEIELNMETERDLAASEAVANLAVQRLGLSSSPQLLLKNLSVEINAESEILTISYRDVTPEGARRATTAFAEAYLSFRQDQARAGLERVVIPLEERLEELNRRLNELTTEPVSEAEELSAATLATEIALIERRIARITTVETLQVGEIVNGAELPTVPSSPRYALEGTLAFFLGIGLGLGQAFVRERLDDRVRTGAELEASVGAPLLAVVPNYRGARDVNGLPSVADPNSPAAQAYRTLRAGLLFRMATFGANVVMVTSPNAGDGKTTTAANLAVTAARVGRRVVVVSGDLRHPQLHTLFGTSNGRGLLNVLAEGIRPEDVLMPTAIENLWIVPSGSVPGNRDELLGSDGMRDLLTVLRTRADLVLIDSAPVLPVADTLTLAPHVDAALIVVNAQATGRAAVIQARQQLDHVNARVIGTVLNRPLKVSTVYPYGYQSRYTDVGMAGEDGVRTPR